jgi:hypothetical protein
MPRHRGICPPQSRFNPYRRRLPTSSMTTEQGDETRADTGGRPEISGRFAREEEGNPE